MRKTTTSIVGLLLLLPITVVAQSAPAAVALATDANDFSTWATTYAYCKAMPTSYTDGVKKTLDSPFKTYLFTVYRRPGVEFGGYEWLNYHFRHTLSASRHVVITSDNKRQVTRFISSGKQCLEFASISAAAASKQAEGSFYSEGYTGVRFPPACEAVSNTSDMVIGTHCTW